MSYGCGTETSNGKSVQSAESTSRPVPSSAPESEVVPAPVDGGTVMDHGGIGNRLQSSIAKAKPNVAKNVQISSHGGLQIEFGNTGSDASDEKQWSSFEERLEVELDPIYAGAPIAWRTGRDVWRCAYCDWELTGESCSEKSCPGCKIVSKRVARRKASDKLPNTYDLSLPKS
ncbi:hypothetical protein FKW77_009478 [Venturia effusa]|uniref:Uncharacterized protein n=1 Tax=Venturia effusa TaxID=50376 RepID=A0A517LCZ6_9PEZI|nr:hypothetical protein FKW77_009478 [Venturia effusa]